MKRDPLAVLWRLRDAAVTDASRALATGLQQERAARERVVAHADAMRFEQAGAGADSVLAFAAWLPRAQGTAAGLQDSLSIEQDRAEHLQQALVAARTDAEGIAEALKQRRAAAGLLRSRAEQTVLDEAAGRKVRQGGFPARDVD